MSAGGAERVVSNILKHLSDDFDFHLILLNKTIQYDLPKGLPIHFLDNENLDESSIVSKLFSLLKIPILAFRLKKYCEQHDIPIVFSLLSRPNYINCFLKIIKKEMRVVISQRMTVSSYYLSTNLSGRINRFLTQYLYPKADLIVSNSNGTQYDLIQNYGLKNALSTIYNPFDFEDIKRQKQDKIVINEQKNDKIFTFISVGRLHPVKNYALLLKSFAQLNDKTTRLTIVGDASQSTEDLPDLARELGVEKQVVFTGFQSNPFQYMANADAYVLSSDSEGFPNVLVEAMACGLPIISTDCISGPREILAPQTDYRTVLREKGVEKAAFGLLTPVNDVESLTKALFMMRNDDGLRQHYITQNLICLSSFQKESVLANFHEIFT
jgi:N-acetylgalactosamine-N,N'-diacetylbacillosaminyl-diphospho-undecaprenol 4-alpha-N-acetylgalactosaminyltransferase